MPFLMDLALIVAALVALACLIAAPRRTIVFAAMMAAGYVGSGDGFLGTCIGLAAGLVGGGVLAALFSAFVAGLKALGAWWGGLDPSAGPAVPRPQAAPDTQDRAD